MSADSSPGGLPSGAGTRASDADRDRTLDALRAAAGDGRLTSGEFSERMEAALASRTLGELAALTADLGDVAGVAASPAGAGDTVRIVQRGGSVRRSGRWVVPRRLKLRASWSVVTLDFTDAVITGDTVRIDVRMRGGALILVTRPGIEVNADLVRARWAGVAVGADAGHGVPATLRVQLAGRIRFGKIEERRSDDAPRSR